MSPEAAALLAAAFLEDAVSRARAVAGTTTVLFRTGADAGSPDPFPDLTCLAQEGADLGERMSAALGRLLSGGGRKAVIIGTDSPTLPSGRLESAFEALSTSDVVLGPTVDGGYYLVGLTAPRPEIFRGIRWSTPTVLQETLKRVQEHDLQVSCLAPWYDVDDGDALMFLVRELAEETPTPGPSGAAATRAALLRLGLLES